MIEKLCNNCKVTKPVEDFYSVNKRGKPTVFHLCKQCCALQKAGMRAYYRDWELRKKYGITLEEYQQQSQARDNSCDICSKVVDSLHVDHCHKTNKIRGYLCGSCNRGIGLLQDSPEVLQKAKQYLESNV